VSSSHTGSPRIVIAAGGTAGHVAPALAVARELRSQGADVQFIGGGRAEATLVPAAGFPLHRLGVEGISRSSLLRALTAIVRAAGASLRARRMLRRLRPAAVLGGGGYVAGPVGLAAVSLRIPLVLSEGDSHLGLANRMLAPVARRVCLSFPIAGRDAPRYRVTGRPIPFLGGDRVVARERFEIPTDQDCVLVFGGSLGARSINEAALGAFAESPFHVLHVTGARDYPELSARRRRPGYDLREYLDLEDFASALSAADLVVARAGSSVLEVAAHGLPAVLVPYPHATSGHQLQNARFMEEAGAARVIVDGELSPSRLARDVAMVLGDRARMEAMTSAARRVARPQAAAEIAAELLEAART
jgi:UDP-N-acetylglucosamine--N-acetylmuramyl-(pentapeptide) pyrophosphoryl-undecaprenol N-acetylglucosamine transferase